MNIWDILVYLLMGLLGMGLLFLAFIIWALVHVSQEDEELARERRMREGT